ncbi:MAG: ferritin family protein, partial [Deltaproteobacteria bacterium]|nr:ferritin family protein [Deltaproteobacteria bacterium]
MNQKNENIFYILNTAIKMETDGIEFYQKASKKTSHPFGKKMFLSFMEDEKLHLKILKEIAQKLEIPDVDGIFKKDTPKVKVKTIFQEVKDDIKEKIAAHPDELQTLQLAIEMEKKGYDLYKGKAEETLDQKEKAL